MPSADNTCSLPRFDPSRVRRYYDRHTPAFVTLGEGRQSGAIHRAVWGPGVRHVHEAIHHVDEQIAEAIALLQPEGDRLHVLDLGCGIGATLTYLARRLPIRGTGVTLSGVQQQLAAKKFEEAAGFEHGVADVLTARLDQISVRRISTALIVRIVRIVRHVRPERLGLECAACVIQFGSSSSA